MSMTAHDEMHGFADPNGRLADNIVYFVRVLRKAGLRIGPSSTIDAIDAVCAGGLGSREHFYWTLHCILVKRREDRIVFDEAFRLFWRSRELVEKMLAMFSPQVEAKRQEKMRAGENRVSNALFEGHRKANPVELPPQIEVDARATASGKEVLRSKDFSQMSAEEIAEAKRAIAVMRTQLPKVKTRRYMASAKGRVPDMRATLRAATRSGGAMVLPQFKAPRQVVPPLVVLADISGSMSQYSRLFLHFVHAVSEGSRDCHAFVFGTRLTNITRQIRSRDIDVALDSCARTVEDWSGGTRIGDTLAVFNRTWSRRVLGRKATVLLITDGLERDGIETLQFEAERLHKSCHRLIWLNPLMRFDGFEPRARGIRVLLHHVDEFRPVHSLDSLDSLCRALCAPDTTFSTGRPTDWLRAAERIAA